MKKIQIALFFTLLSSFVFSQKCEIKSDPFTKERIVSFDFKKRSIYYELKNDVIKLEFIFNYSGELNVAVPKGTELLFKLENGETVKLLTVSQSHPKTRLIANQASASVLTNYTYVFNVNKEELSKLAISKVILVRYPDTKGDFLDFEIKVRGRKYATALYEGAQCIQSNL